MRDEQLPDVSSPDEELDTNTSSNPSFDGVVHARVSRRQVLSGTAGAAALTMLGGMKIEPAFASEADLNSPRVPRRAPRLGFTPVAKSLEDAVVLPPNYSYDVLYRLGDPIAASVPDYANDGSDAPGSFAFRAGDHHDGIHYFGLGPNGRHAPNNSHRGLLCMNHEAITPSFLHPTGQTIVAGARTAPDEVLREFYVHGVSVIEVT